MNTVELDIDFGANGNSTRYVRDGWGTPEPGHTWSVGQQSNVFLPASDPAGDYVLAFRARPWLHPPEITHQTLLLGLDDRLLATVALDDDAALAFELPPPAGNGDTGYVLSINHLDSGRSARFDTYRDGRSMGLLMRRMRLVRRARARLAGGGMRHPACLPPLAGTLADGSLIRAMEVATGQSLATVAGAFESLGQWCLLAEMQDRYGAANLGLLRFAGLNTPDLIEGLYRGFEGVGQGDQVTAFHSTGLPGKWDVQESEYRIWWHTGRGIADYSAAAIVAFERKRLAFLQRKFVDTLATSAKAFVLTYEVSDSELLAIHCALGRWGANTLVYPTQSGAAEPGTVERVGPGLLRGHVDRSGQGGRGSFACWTNVFANAYRLIFAV